MYTKFLIYSCGFIFVLYFLLIFLISILSFAFNGHILGEFVYCAIILSGLICAITLRAIFGKGLYFLGAVIPVFVLIIGLVYGVAVNQNIYDISFDGQSYQGEAVVTLINDWNPIREINSTNSNEYVSMGKNDRWLDAYPKASWYNSVAMHRITGDFKDTKFFNISIIFATLFVVFSALLKISFSKDKVIDYGVRFLLTVLLSLNPIALVQATTLNLDGQIYSFLLILFCTLFLLYKSFNNNFKLTTVYYVNIAILLIVLTNIKTAGLVYGLFFFGSFAIYTLFTRYLEWKNLLLTFLCSLLLGICVFGYNPYITNLTSFGNVLYPQFGSYSFDYTENTPSNYREKNNAQIFFTSLFFKTSEIFLDGVNEPAELKLPLTIYESEINALKNSQIKKGGFGPLFSGIILLSLTGLLAAFASYYIDITKNNPYLGAHLHHGKISGLIAIAFISTVFVISFILTKTSNTYRYIPHLWTLIGLWTLFSYQSKSSIARLISVVVIILSFINMALICTVYYTYQIEKSKEIATLIQKWKQSGDTYIVDFGYHTSMRELFIENKIAYKNRTDKLFCDPYKADQNIMINDKFSMVYGCLYTN